MAQRKTGFYFSNTDYVLLDMDAKTVTSIVDGESTVYEMGGEIERKLLYTNPDTTIEMTGADMFAESELEGYDYIEFIVTDTDGSYEVKELCEIAPLKAHGGQFVVSMPFTGALYVRKIYRGSGMVKPSTGVYDIGKTTGDRTKCIIKEAYAVKGVL